MSVRAFVTTSTFHRWSSPVSTTCSAFRANFMCANRETSANRLRIGRRSALALVTIPIVGILWTMKTSANNEKVVKSDDEWMKTLGPERFKVMRKGGTEWSFTSDLNKEKRKGVYKCGACGNPLYDSETKYDSGTGWPSFWKPLDGGIAYNQSLMDKIVGQREVLCAKCNSHLGHVFRDGPRPTGERYCMNGIAMTFEPSS